MTREEIIEKICLSSEIQNDECIDCAYCMEILNDYFDKYDKQIRTEVRAEIYGELMSEIAELNEVEMNKNNLMTFAYRIKQIAEQLKEQK